MALVILIKCHSVENSWQCDAWFSGQQSVWGQSIEKHINLLNSSKLHVNNVGTLPSSNN